MNEGNKSHHILNTSSTLLGLCFIILTAIKIQKLSEATIIDEITSIATILFMVSCLLSFLSIRSETIKGVFYEKFADILFLIGLMVMFVLTMLISFTTIK